MTSDRPPHSAPPPVFQPLHPDDPREVGGYRLVSRLGSGGMGRVYLSYTPGGRPVALKVVRPEFAEDGEFRRRFAQEVRSAQRIHGLYTAQVIDSGGLDTGAPWLVTSYVPGPSLQQVVREHGPLPVRTVLLLVGGIAEALQAIHSVQVVHRDLKPANVLVAADGPRVIDFGIARAADATALTGTGYRIGSPAFMSPEQAQGGPITAATDVFALGALTTYVAGGAPPFGDGPDSAVLYRVVHEAPDLSTVPPPLRELIARCLAKAPQDRPTPAELIRAAREHPVVGGRLQFDESWLPDQVNTEITRRADLPQNPPPPQNPPTALPAPPPDPPARPTEPVQPSPSPRPPVRRGVSWKTLLVVALVTLLAGTAGGLALRNGLAQDGKGATDSQQHGPTTPATTPSNGAPPPAPSSPAPSSPAPSASASPRVSASAGGSYVAVYENRELASPGGAYGFDLPNGRVAPSGTPATFVDPTVDGLSLDTDYDLYIGRSDPLTPQQCSDAIDRSPGAHLRWEDLPTGRLFCVRNRKDRSVAVVRIVSHEAGSDAVRISLGYYRYDS